MGGSSSGYTDPRISYAMRTLYGAAPDVGKSRVAYHNPTSNADEYWDWRQQYDTYKTGLGTAHPGARTMPYGLWQLAQRYNPESEFSGWWTQRHPAGSAPPPAGGTAPPSAGTPPPGSPPPGSQANQPPPPPGRTGFNTINSYQRPPQPSPMHVWNVANQRWELPPQAPPTTTTSPHLPIGSGGTSGA
jgi:hypothetical protein